MNVPDEGVRVAVEHFPWFAGIVVVLTLLSLPHIAQIVRTITPAAEPERVHWRIRHALLVALALIVTQGVAMRTWYRPDDGAGLLILSSATMFVPVLLVLYVAWTQDPRRLAALGLQPGHALTAPIAGVVALFVALPGILALGFLWIWLLGRADVEVHEQLIVQSMRSIVGGERWVVIVLGALVQPFFEEVLFRGFLQPLLVQQLRPAAGIALTSAVFAGLHGVSPFLPIFALSCVLGYVMMRTQRLHAAWAAHALFNGLQFLVMYALPDWVEQGTHPGGLLQSFTR